MLRNFQSKIDKTTLAFLILLAWLVLIVLSEANPYLTLPGRDNGFFLYAGSRLLNGDRLYIDLWDHKGPGIFFINALGLFLGQNSRWGVWFLEFVFIFLSFYLGYVAVKKVWGNASALIGVLIGLYALKQVLEKGNLTEEYPLLFNFLAIYLFAFINKKQSFPSYILIGALFGLSFLFRANNGGIPISIGLTALVMGIFNRDFVKMIKDLAGIALGVLIVALLTVLYFELNGTFQEFISAAFTYNFLDTQGRTNIFLGFLAGLKNIQNASYPLIIGYLAVFYKTVLAFRQREAGKSAFEWLLFCLIALPVEVLLSSLSGKNFVHYFICWVPVIFLLSGFAYHTWSEAIFSKKFIDFAHSARALSVVLVLTLLFSYPIAFDYATTFQTILFNRQNGIDMSDRLTDYVRSNTAPADKVLVWGGEASINFMSRRVSPTRYTLFSRLLTRHPMNPAISETFYQDVVNNPPVLIVDMWKKNPDSIPPIDPALRVLQDSRKALANLPAYVELLDYINAHYELETRIEGYEIYRLKD